MLAGDHRAQWEQFCDQRGIDRGRIPEVKGLIVDAFLDARRRSVDVQHSGSLHHERSACLNLMKSTSGR